MPSDVLERRIDVLKPFEMLTDIVFGKAITSRIVAAPAKAITNL
jgi:hypothetical protein